VAAGVATLTACLLAAGCSGGTSSAGAAGSAHPHGSSSSASAVAYAACVRSHGVPNYPDPGSNGNLTKAGAQQFGVSSSQFQAAQQACADLLPDTGGSFTQQFQECVQGGVCPQALVQQALTLMRSFARCLRAHGVPNWPDPTIGRRGAPFFNASGAGLTHDYTHSAGFVTKVNECQREVGGSTGVPVLMG
jgi:hypothetical protein